MSDGHVDHPDDLHAAPHRAFPPPSRNHSPCAEDASDTPADQPSSSPAAHLPYVTRPGLVGPPQIYLPSSVSSAKHLQTQDPGRGTSPDPDDYYRNLPNLPSNPARTRTVSNKDSPNAFARVDSVPDLPTDGLAPSRTRLSQHRATSDSFNALANPPLKPSPPLSSAPSSRQASFKDLVNKFNTNCGQTPSRPSVPSSREPSRAPSPSSGVDAPVRPLASRFRATPDASIKGQQSDSTCSSESASPQNLVPPPLRVSDNKNQTFPSNLNRSDPPHRSLERERLAVDTSWLDPPYGIPAYLLRRGSEGSISSPNPANRDRFESCSGRSPQSPTAWHRVQMPNAVTTGGKASSHRRTKSDFSRGQSVTSWVDSTSPMAVPPPLHAVGSVQTPTHSRSRIPIPRQFNADPTPAWASNSSLRSAQPPLSAKGASRLPKPSPKSPAGMANDASTPFATTSFGRREMTSARTRPQPERGPLQARIAAPPPADSPPLRSSRPRQHVTASSSRSKVVDRVSSFQDQISRDQAAAQDSHRRGRRLPELGDVDFATRRQRIQQAFNKTVQENERQAEEAAELRRNQQVHAEEQRVKEEQRITKLVGEQPCQDTVEASPETEDAATEIEESPELSGEEQPPIPEEEAPRKPQDLHVETDLPVQEDSSTYAEDHPVTMDSPTLGLPSLPQERDAQRLETKTSDVPASAGTERPTDARSTTCDDELQTGLTRHNLNMSHRTLLSQIMQIRESSTSDSSCDEAEYNVSDHDDRESIPIMLRDTAYLEDAKHDIPTHQLNDNDNDRQNRWSTSSWSSTFPNQLSAEEQYEEYENGAPQQPAPLEGSEPTTQSCSAASSPPPSVTARHHEYHDQPAELQKENALPRDSRILSTAPSLARQGGWDSRRVTRLYLEELARGGNHNLPMSAIRAPHHSKTDGKTDSLTEDPVVVPRLQDILSSDSLGQASSLVFRDDWEHASPSIADWMHVAAEDVSAPDDEDATGAMHDGAPTPRLPPSEAQPAHPEEAKERLGLAIHVESPHEAESEEIPPPPIPRQSPPPPPTQIHSQPRSSSTQASQAFAPLAPVNSAGSSEISVEPTPSPLAVGSSATSLVPSHVEPVNTDVPKRSPTPERRRLTKRRHVIKELIDTEYSFGRDMKVVDDIYKGTSSSCLDLSAEDVKVLFANSEQVVHFSMAFQDALKSAAKSVYVMPKSQRWTSKRRARNGHSSEDQPFHVNDETSEYDHDQMTFIGETFMAHMPQMERVYADYLKNHDAANKKLQTLQRNPKVAIWLSECRDWASDLTSAWDLDSLLVKPVQRIVKYPLLLNELLDATPPDHPDQAALVRAVGEVTNVSVRINEMKKRADVVGRVVARKRKESDVRTGLSKAFGRRTEKLRQQVGLSDMFEDKEYDSLSQRFGDGYFQLQVVMRDVEVYTRAVQGSLGRLMGFVSAIEGWVDVARSNYSDLETKWRQLRMTVRDIMTASLPDHLAVVRRSVINPMVSLLKLHEGPQRVMHKRDKRLMDYARFKTTRDRGDKPDKKTSEQGEQFMALNETLKDELPKLYSLTAKLMEACLKNFVQIQTDWFNLLEKRLEPLTEGFPHEIQKIVSDWSSGFSFAEAQVHALGICNGSVLADVANQQVTPSTGATASMPRRPSTVHSSSTRMGSSMDESPKMSYDFNSVHSFKSAADSQSQIPGSRHGADSGIASRVSTETQEVPRREPMQMASQPQGPAKTGGKADGYPSLPRLSLDAPFSAEGIRPSEDNPPTSPAGRYSGFFSSAMPMSDAPDEVRAENEQLKEPKVLFLAASVYEFNIDRARREAGYPYLTYVAGEIFDVIAEKGELWLARNQDDPHQQVGWIWTKHFAKLSTGDGG